MQIIPLEHCWSLTGAPEDVAAEVLEFQRALVRYFEEVKHQGVVFLETVVGKAHKERYQTRIECVPMGFEEAADASIYFKKALQEAGETWSTHPKIIQTTAQRGLRRAVPDNFPYFHVEWASTMCPRGNGYVHVIEDESKFNRRSDFGFDVVLGLLGEDPRLFNRARKHGSRSSHNHKRQREQVMAFVKGWGQYDFTQKL